jgi:tetratricopeptide (TPR) repeat protein
MKAVARVLVGLSIALWWAQLNAQAPINSASTIQHITIEQEGWRELSAVQDRLQADDHVDMAPSDPKVSELITAGESAFNERRFKDAQAAYQQALSRLNRPRDEVMRGGALTLLGMTLFNQGEIYEAGQSYDAALPLLSRHLTPGSATLALVTAGQAGIAQATGRVGRAQALIATVQQNFPPVMESADSVHRRTLIRMAQTFRALHLPKVAEPYARAVLKFQDEYPQQDSADLAVANFELAAALHAERGDTVVISTHPANAVKEPSEAEVYAQRAIQMLDRHHSADSALLIPALYVLAREQMMRLQWEPATQSLQRAIAISRQRSAFDRNLSSLNTELAEVFNQQARYAEAAAALQEAVTIDRRSLPDQQETLAGHLDRLGIMQCRAHQCIDGVKSTREALALYRKLPLVERQVECQIGLVEELRRSGTLTEADATNKEALQLYDRAAPARRDELGAWLHRQRGEILLEQGQSGAAIDEFHAMGAFYEKMRPDLNPLGAQGDAGVAAARYALGEKDAAWSLASATADLYRRKSWPMDSGYGLAARALGLMALERNDTAAGIRYLRQSWKVRMTVMAGGEVTLQQGWEFADVLGATEGRDDERSQVIESLYEMLADSPHVAPVLRLKVIDNWAQILRRRQQLALAEPLEQEVEMQCRNTTDQDMRSFCAGDRARRRT